MQFIRLIFVILLLASLNAKSQCTTTINTFPYTESFETGNNGWTSGGINDSWARGIPSKSQITNAVAGLRCWVTGGLSGSPYNNGERSYVTSPCFNFTNINNPYFTAKIWWESEQNFDGTTFQYSTNNGATWTNVGSSSDPVNCLNENWFNSPNINFLNGLANPKDGWSGSITNTSQCPSTNGSNTWVTAKHCMSNLAGLPSVQFRFAFGAGTFCNTFDGFAFDDIFIGEAPANLANFSYFCNGNPLTYQFTNTSTPCPSGYSWNFGDPNSGSSNNTILPSPTHTFSAPGTYTVTLTAFGPCNGTSTVSQNIVTIDGNLTPTSPLCNNVANGTITATSSNANGNVLYTLSPNGNISSFGIFTNLSAGNYTISVSDASNCVVTKTTTLTNPNPISWQTFTVQDAACFSQQNGSINANAIGGIGNKTYVLNPGNLNSINGNFSNLGAGNYIITATDANNCTLTSAVSITQPSLLNFQNLTKSDITCFGQNNGSIQTNAIGGTSFITYALQPSGNSNLTGFFQSLAAGNYTVIASDVNGCSTSTSTMLNNANPILISNISSVNPDCNPNNNGSIQMTANGGTGILQYSIDVNFSTNPNFQNLIASTYTITIKDANNCTFTTSVTLNSPPLPSFISSSSTAASCFGETNGTLNTTANGSSPILNYSLLPSNQSSTTGNFTNLSSQNYTVVVTDSKGCSATTASFVNQPDLLKIESIQNTTSDSCSVDFKATIQVNLTGGTQPASYRIIPGGSTNNSGIFANLKSGSYQITVTDANNCTTSASFNIKEQICCGNVIVPSAFSPNRDGRNDELRLLNDQGITLREFAIFNRYGQAIFKAQGLFDAWDGTFKGIDSEIGTYYYQVKYKCDLTQKEYYLKGDINLIR